ncbi:MAG: hypothetical protein JKP90_10355 [Desulfofustis sp. PB-SRB1]|nr:hypothetical protein [Desulfofustis sp. PB-SRB1]
MVLFLEHEGITELVQFNRDALHLFQEDLAYRLTAKGKQLSVQYQGKVSLLGSRLCPVSLCNGLSYR